MMAKYTDEEIIAYLRTLREGDVLTAVKSDEDASYTTGRRYSVSMDDNSDLCVRDNDGFGFNVNKGGEYVSGLFFFLRKGTFEIPSPLAESIYVSIRQIAEIHPGGIPYKSVTVRVDDAGFAELEGLEHRSVKSRELAGLYARRAEIQAEIDRFGAL